MTSWESLSKYVEGVEEVLIVSHYNPDGDAISSTLVMGQILRQYGKKVTMVNEHKVPSRFLYLEGAKEIYLCEEIENLYSHVITVDCADIARVGKCRSLFSKDVQIINIDHHKTNDHYGFMNFVDVHAASTTQVLYDLLISANVCIDVPLAKMLYTGLITDTGGFRYSNTTSSVMKMAAELIELGVDPYEMAEKAIESISFEYVQLLQIALQSLQVSDDGKIASISLSYQDLERFIDPDTEGLVQYTRNIDGVEVGILFKEWERNHVKISFRSKLAFDVATFAKHFDGGGHARASGCSVKGSLKDVQSRVLNKLKDELESLA